MSDLRKNIKHPLKNLHWNPTLSFSKSSETCINSALRDGTAIEVSDGYFKEDWGSAALIIEGLDHATHQLSATCIIPGHPKDQDSYRSELAGIFHMVSIVEEISRKFIILEGAITIACDGPNEIKRQWNLRKDTHASPITSTSSQQLTTRF